MKELCWTLGRYDVVAVFEAADDESAAALALSASSVALAEPAAPAPAPASPPDESALGELVITGHKLDKLPRIAILPSLSPDLEDVMVRSVVRHDIELTGMFDVVKDADAPPGLYGFDDPVDVAFGDHAGRSSDGSTGVRRSASMAARRVPVA